MVIVDFLGLERVKTTVANEGSAVVFGSAVDEAGHVLNPSIVFSGRVIRVFQEQEIDMMGSVTLGRKIFYAETILVFFVDTQHVHAYFGIELFEKGYLFCLHGKIDSFDIY